MSKFSFIEECEGKEVEVIMRDDATLEFIDYDMDYDLSMVEFGEEHTSCSLLSKDWRKNYISALLNHVIPDPETIMELLYDTVSQALNMAPSVEELGVYLIKARLKRISKLLQGIYHLIAVAKDPSNRILYQLAPTYEMLQEEQKKLFDTDVDYRKQLNWMHPDTDRHAIAQLSEAAGYTARAARPIAASFNKKTQESYERLNAESAIQCAAWSMTFSKGLKSEKAFERSRLWVLGRFIEIMNAREEGREKAPLSLDAP